MSAASIATPSFRSRSRLSVQEAVALYCAYDSRKPPFGTIAMHDRMEKDEADNFRAHRPGPPPRREHAACTTASAAPDPKVAPPATGSATGDSNYRFGAFELLVRRQLLLYAGAPVHIGSRALTILTVLVEGAAELITKETLIAAAWPTTFVDVSNLKVNVASLRRALASKDPREEYIATVPGRGYRFVAPVHRIFVGPGGLPPENP